jgi:hypothetical protein
VTSHWTKVSIAVIREALQQGRAEGLEGAEPLARVDAAYPFGERRHWPYQVWLRERRKLCRSLLPPGKAGPQHELDRLDALEADMRRVEGSMRGPDA